jgi:hypothetical protein
VPVISRFYGITIYMFHDDHAWPHFHVEYGEFDALVSLDGTVQRGQLPPRVRRLVNEWAMKYHDELEEDWKLAEQLQPLRPIAPLL